MDAFICTQNSLGTVVGEDMHSSFPEGQELVRSWGQSGVPWPSWVAPAWCGAGWQTRGGVLFEADRGPLLQQHFPSPKVWWWLWSPLCRLPVSPLHPLALNGYRRYVPGTVRGTG